MDDNEEHCTKCNKRIDPLKMIMLEYNGKTLKYHKPGDVPENESQGLFPFGADCAKRILKNDQ